MKDGMEYAEMLGLTVSSCDVVVKPTKKRKRKEIKEQVVEPPVESQTEEVEKVDLTEFEELKGAEQKEEKGFKFDIVYFQGVAIFALIVTILLTNIFWENSGINTLFRNVFAQEVEEVDARTYLSFSAKSPSSELTSSVDEGVMTFSGKGALYPVCDGTVTSIVEEDGKYTLTISHSDVFKTVISGADFVYTEKGEQVYGYIPVCYVAGGDANVYMYDEDVLLTNYIVEDGVIVWES